MSDRPAPKFAVGEEAFLDPVYSPHLKGDIVVIDRRYGSFKHEQTGQIVTGWVYRTTADSRWWQESSLQKRHRPDFMPSTQSFTELLQSIQQPNKVKA